MKHLMKQGLRRLSPLLLETMIAYRCDWRNQQSMRRNGLVAIARRLVERHGLEVASGPFVGMTYVSSSVGSAYLPKLIGSYEYELHPVLEQVASTLYDTVVDVGCAEGYYAVGLARRLPTARVHAFDLYPTARRQCRHLARLNAVTDRVEIGGFCDVSRLNAVLSAPPPSARVGRRIGRSLVVCDCEGYERQILRPDAVPGLVTSDIIVELHGFLDSDIRSIIMERFQDTHRATLVRAAERDPRTFPMLGFLSPDEQRLALWEMRPPGMEWAFLEAMS